MPDLCKIEDLRAWLKIDGAKSQAADPILERLISACSADMLRYMDRPDLASEVEYTELYSAEDAFPLLRRVRPCAATSYKLHLNHWPVNSITSVSVDGVALASSADAIAAGYFLDPHGDPEDRDEVTLVGVVLNGCGTVERAYCGTPSTIVVKYKAGYATVPADIEQAAIELAAYRYTERGSVGQSSKSMPGGDQVHFEHWDFPPSVKCVMDHYAGKGSLL